MDPATKLISIEDSYHNSQNEVDDDFDDWWWEVDVEKLESIDVTIDGQYLVQHDHPEVVFQFDRDLGQFDGAVTIGLDSLVDILGDYVGTLPTSVTIPQGEAGVDLVIPTSVGAIPHTVAWYFQPFAQRVTQPVKMVFLRDALAGCRWRHLSTITIRSV